MVVLPQAGAPVAWPAVTPDAWLLTVAVVLLLLVAWTAWTLTRLRRLEARVARAWTALDTQLQRRAGLAEELARDFPDAPPTGAGAWSSFLRWAQH